MTINHHSRRPYHTTDYKSSRHWRTVRISDSLRHVINQPDTLGYYEEYRKPCAAARWLMRQKDFVVWDTETTGLEDDSKIVSIGIVNKAGETLVNALIHPAEPIPPDATAIHGVTDEDVKDAPLFPDVYEAIRDALEGQIWVIYNKGYDIPRLNYECDRYYLPRILPLIEIENSRDNSTRKARRISYSENKQTFCAMNMFAKQYGQWHDYFSSYTWQKLTTAAYYYGFKADRAHNALGDALTTLQLIKNLALDEDIERKH